MGDLLLSAMNSAGAALRAQSIRIRVATENLANSETTSDRPGGAPYTRKTVAFANLWSRRDGGSHVVVRKISEDPSPYRVVRASGHPAADQNGNVLLPNVDPIVEIADLKEANRAYEANLQLLRQARDLINMTFDLLKT